jgi:hypothetical protein
VSQPSFAIVPAEGSEECIRGAAEAVGFPCVVKAVSLSASQGVLRADDQVAALTAVRPIRQVLAAARRPRQEPLLVEEYLPGPELSIDGLLADGELAVTAVFDKPHTPDGPTFEETLPVPVAGYDRARPSGVFMLPVPGPGVLRAVEGRADVAAVPGITGLTITIPVGQRVLPLPDGDRYLGFIFAEADIRQDVEQALIAARDQLRVVID